MSQDQDIATLKKQRAITKSGCTRIRRYVESVTAVTPSVIAQLQERKERLDGYWADYNDQQSQIELLEESEANDREGFENAFYTLSAKIRELIMPVSQTSAPTGSRSSSRASPLPEAQINVRLPKLNLPTFSGSYHEWFPFYDSFNSVIHSNTSLNNIQRLQYLKAALTGDASELISSLEISDSNYKVAWNLLRDRYDNKRVIVHNHVKAIMELPSMTKENLGELRQIADGATKHIQALEALKRPTSQWDDLLVNILSSKLDALTLREWQTSLTGTDPPTYKQFSEFITHRCQMLEATGKSASSSTKNTGKQFSSRRQASCVATVKPKCNYCNGEHAMYYCKDFLALSIPQRTSEVRSRKICSNCLRSSNHVYNKCTSRGCRICKAKHNTLLHSTDDSAGKRDDESNDHKEANTNSPKALVTHTKNNDVKEYVMLSTAVINVLDAEGSMRPCRVLLDSGSQANFITKQCLNSLALQPRPLNVSISGINNASTNTTQAVKVKLQSRYNNFSATIECIVTDQITGNLPAFTRRRESYNIPRNIKLADPQFNVSSGIDILIGAEVFWDLLCVGQIKSSPEHPKLQKTQFGWILAGRLDESSNTRHEAHSFHVTVTNAHLHDQLSKFWQIEDIHNASERTIEEDICEKHFLANVSKNTQGRYVVKLPTKDAVINQLGDSKGIALKRLQNLERRFSQNPQLKEQYAHFMNEYLTLGHMKKTDAPSDEEEVSYYLPHHCVFKDSKQLSKIRVVFDASCKSTSGVSLNDALRVGPVLQQDLMSIIMRFRTFAYVLTADIIKMYRQVLVHPTQTRLQRILWRDDPSSDIDVYELSTVTYGTSSASFLVTRCLKDLAERYSSEFPIGSMHVQRDFYVDDLLTGADTLQDAKRIQEETTQLLKLGAFELSKWASNCPQLLESVGIRNDNLIAIDDRSRAYILGIQWNQTNDTFHFSYEPRPEHETVSKRSILSEVSMIFDPLGLLGPTIIIAKLILQDLWRLGSQWDESPPQHIHTRWLTVKSQLVELNQLKIPRCVKLDANPQAVQLHGFCDASQHAYGACVYIRTRIGPNEYHCELLCSKSRVAPLKATSLPRLELSAAFLLARLVEKIRSSIDTSNIQTFLWSDSTITLNWISSPSRKWAVFVANRVGEIQRLTDLKQWRHVPSAQNPADLLSRGLSPRELVDAETWWHGPCFLLRDHQNWPDDKFPHLGNEMPEMRKTRVNIAVIDCSIVDELLSKHSSLDKICRILAYCLRFLKTNPRQPTRFITHEEITSALHLMCKIIQQRSFPEEYETLSNKKVIGPSSRILSLSPFMDENGLIRVGGRLKNSNLPFNACHPILLPRNQELTKQIITREHVRCMHAGTQATMAAIRQQFWPLSLRSLTRKIILGCVRCFKVKPTLSEATMAPLPVGRVTISRPFSHCGVDYAGPMILREGKRRNARNHKAYVAIFVCFAVKAVHLELVSDLTSEAFLAAFKRFISRRGKPSHMHSDNGTTFVGTQNQLKELFNFLNKDSIQEDIKQFLRQQQTSWSFIPPHAPHHGGLWEAAVKSAKFHMNRIVGKAHLTFEEMQTVFCEIEAILNSRPLTALSADPNDLLYLSPGHFLVGTTMNGPPCQDLSDVNENRLTRWHRVEQLRQHFWRRWSAEYLSSLQLRSKWKSDKGVQLKPNQVVLIRQQNLAPLHWLLGRVSEVHTGTDGIARTATVKTAKGYLTRPLSSLAILPIETSNEM